ncbi:zinc finger protein 728 [Episyrphus balteatus]|uniref:zinc finger protein 728 n=1 Tax=Episyrphus balteatus TaxID=286459 RepID=UPI00248648C3|nr:zinc finger protein 728 [Episyrphus balteatus]
MKFNCLRCNNSLENEFQLIFDETGIELQLDKLLADIFEISVVRDPSLTQALCDGCVNLLIELYDAQKFKEEEKLDLPEDNHSNQQIEEITSEIDTKEEVLEDDMIIEEIEEQTENEEEFKEIIEESNSMDNEEFLGFKETEEKEDKDEHNSSLNELNLQHYLEDVIKSDLELISFDQNSVCKLCDETLNSHKALLFHISDSHKTESEQYPCIFCEEVSYFDSITNLAVHVVLKHYDLNSITIYCTCPECNTRFSSFLEYNKHSCYKQSYGSRLIQECDQCSKKFISNKRYRFHLQFHLNKQRPKACFICDILFSDENDFFEHIMFAHQKEDSFVCKKCDRVCTTKQLYDNHMELHNSVKSFHCQYCPKSYFYNQMLINHVQQQHSDKQQHQCEICNKTLTNRHLLKRHMQIVHMEETEDDVFVCSACGLIGISEEEIMFHSEDDKCLGAETIIECLKIAYACEFCELAFKSIDTLKQHREIHQDNVFKCWICEGTYLEFKKLKTHILTHNKLESIQQLFPINRHYVCDIDSCDQSYLTWPSLRAHKNRHATKFTCEICSQAFTTESKLHAHLKSHDTNEEYPCQFCPKLCISQMSLSVHVARKHNNNYKTCPTCKSTCSSEEALIEHIEMQHTEAKCEICGKVTKNKRNLQVHIQMIHSQVKRFFCSVCNKGYFNNSDLKNHERALHQEPNKFKCEYCNFSSSYEASFNAHILKHEQNKPFKCDECGREFTRKSSFKLHVLRHSDNKPFVCPVELCGRSFVMLGVLNSHIKNSHPDCEEVKVKQTSKIRSVKKKKQSKKALNQDIDSANSSDYVIAEVYSESEYIKAEEVDGDIVIFDGSNAEEEVVLECSEEADMYI